MNGLRFATLALWLCLGGGCGPGNGLPRVPLEGEVRLDGRPVTSAAVHFFPSEGLSGPSATASVQDGRFAFGKQDGPVAGDYLAELVLSQEKAAETAEFVVDARELAVIPVAIPRDPPFQVSLDFDSAPASREAPDSR